ncbi:MAG: type IV secretory system conjugative DNA transfer family protein [Alphaproteobacteria bacterium]|nr:type IV secretory system conjugative DNA transfer family protein [Reyranella sp.]MBL6940090.1 type IV secretory system conjugative DNA transfer family protein [Alphaproteobacteria bacterium]MBL7100177.1 type IV secretory system conjugative DNA transfer family protein [Alphaproteobacteria bacterium]
MAKDERWRRNGGIYFGYGTDRSEGSEPPGAPNRLLRYADDRHIITIGPNGSGKSRRLLLPNLAALTEWSILVVDPKGDLAAMTREHREKAGSKVIVLNPFGVFGIRSDGFNPLSVLNPEAEDEEFADDAMGLAESLIRVEGREPHFSQSAQELVCALIMYAKLILEDQASLVDVRTMLAQKSTSLRDMVTDKYVEFEGHKVLGMIEAGEKHDCPELVAKASRFADIGPENRELSSVISTALTQTRWLDSRPIKKDIARSEHDFGKMKEEPWTVYLILPARRVVTHSTWLRLMITSVMQPLMKDTRKAKVPVLLMLDEFAQLGHLPAIEQNIGLMRQYGLKLWAVLQDLSQAKHIYEERWESFLANAGVIHSFAPQDVFTANHISQLANGTIAPATLRHMDDGFGIVMSHKLKGRLFSYSPYPDDVPELKDIMALDPAEALV